MGHDAKDPIQSDYSLDSGRWKDHLHQRKPGNSHYEIGYTGGETAKVITEVVVGSLDSSLGKTAAKKRN